MIDVRSGEKETPLDDMTPFLEVNNMINAYKVFWGISLPFVTSTVVVTREGEVKSKTEKGDSPG